MEYIWLASVRNVLKDCLVRTSVTLLGCATVVVKRLFSAKGAVA